MRQIKNLSFILINEFILQFENRLYKLQKKRCYEFQQNVELLVLKSWSLKQFNIFILTNRHKSLHRMKDDILRQDRESVSVNFDKKLINFFNLNDKFNTLVLNRANSIQLTSTEENLFKYIKSLKKHRLTKNEIQNCVKLKNFENFILELMFQEINLKNYNKKNFHFNKLTVFANSYMCLISFTLRKSLFFYLLKIFNEFKINSVLIKNSSKKISTKIDNNLSLIILNKKSQKFYRKLNFILFYCNFSFHKKRIKISFSSESLKLFSIETQKIQNIFELNSFLLQRESSHLFYPESSNVKILNNNINNQDSEFLRLQNFTFLYGVKFHYLNNFFSPKKAQTSSFLHLKGRSMSLAFEQNSNIVTPLQEDIILHPMQVKQDPIINLNLYPLLHIDCSRSICKSRNYSKYESIIKVKKKNESFLSQIKIFRGRKHLNYILEKFLLKQTNLHYLHFSFCFFNSLLLKQNIIVKKNKLIELFFCTNKITSRKIDNINIFFEHYFFLKIQKKAKLYQFIIKNLNNFIKFYTIKIKENFFVVSLDKKLLILKSNNLFNYIICLKPHLENKFSDELYSPEKEILRYDFIKFIVEDIKKKSKYVSHSIIQNISAISYSPGKNFPVFKSAYESEFTNNLTKLSRIFAPSKQNFFSSPLKRIKSSSNENRQNLYSQHIDFDDLTLNKLLDKIQCNSILFKHLLTKRTNFTLIHLLLINKKINCLFINILLNNIELKVKNYIVGRNAKYLIESIKYFKGSKNIIYLINIQFKKQTTNFEFSDFNTEFYPYFFEKFLFLLKQRAVNTFQFDKKKNYSSFFYINKKQVFNFNSAITKKITCESTKTHEKLFSFVSSKDNINLNFLKLRTCSINVKEYLLPELIYYQNQIIILNKSRESMFESLYSFKKSLISHNFVLIFKFIKIKINHTLLPYNSTRGGFNFLGFFIYQSKISTDSYGQGSLFVPAPSIKNHSLLGKNSFFMLTGGYRALSYERKLELNNDKSLLTLVDPAKQEIKMHLKKIKNIITKSNGTNQQNLILKITPHIRLWSYYYKIISNKKILQYCDYVLFKMLWKWSCRRHPNKSKNWIKNKYFHRINGQAWVFAFYNSKNDYFICIPNHNEIKLTK